MVRGTGRRLMRHWRTLAMLVVVTGIGIGLAACFGGFCLPVIPPGVNTWTLHTTTTEGSVLTAIDMVSASDGWAVGSNGRIYHYSGGTWTLHTTTTEGSYLTAIDMVDASDGWAVGEGGLIYHGQ
jgi:hypothetical protein